MPAGDGAGDVCGRMPEEADETSAVPAEAFPA